MAAQSPDGLWAAMSGWGLSRGLEQRGGGGVAMIQKASGAWRAYRGLDSLKPEFSKLI